MRLSRAAAAVAAVVAIAACAGGEATVPEALCPPPMVRAQGNWYDFAGGTNAGEAGAIVGVVQRAHRCNDTVVTVTDSVNPTPSTSKSEPWVDGDAGGLPVGTRLYERVGSVAGQEIVAEMGGGHWWLFRRRAP
jgi:hypothetical protein